MLHCYARLVEEDFQGSLDALELPKPLYVGNCAEHEPGQLKLGVRNWRASTDVE